MSGYIRVAELEGDDVIEIPVESDDTVLLSTLSAQFPGACGMKYRSPETKSLRGVRLVEERLIAPDEGWDFDFFCTFPKNDGKRKSADLLESSTHKTKRMDVYRRCSDLIVLGLPWKTTEEELKEHFGMYGDVIMAQIKKDTKTGQSRGYGFIRFDDFEVQKRVLSIRHVIDGRTCDVKIPNSKTAESSGGQHSGKIFVGRTTEELSADDLREYFEKFGEVTDVFIPKPFRAFAFVTFLDTEVAQSLCGEDHIIKGVSVNISNATPKADRDRDGQRMGGGGGYMSRGGSQGGDMQGGYSSSNSWGQQQSGGRWGNGNRNATSSQSQQQQPWQQSNQQQQWGQGWDTNQQWNYGQQGNSDMSGQFDPKAMNGMGAMAMPFMAALSQQIFGQMNPQMMQQQQQMMEQQQQQYGNPAAPGTTPSQPPAVSNSSYPPPPPNAPHPPSTPTNAPPPQNSWNSTPRHDKYNRHSYHDGKADGY